MRKNWKLFRVKVKVKVSQGVMGISSPGQPVSQSNSLLKQKGLVRDTPNSEFQRYVRALIPPRDREWRMELVDLDGLR